MLTCSHYEKLLKSEEEFDRQIGTAMWIIDRLALRVGGEKDEDEADTVGCCSLRVEHIQFPADRPQHVTLDFLGKDSMRYCNTIDLTRYGEVCIELELSLCTTLMPVLTILWWFACRTRHIL